MSASFRDAAPAEGRATPRVTEGRGAAAASPPGLGEGMADGPINILIVDDEPGNLVVLETVLDDPGYRLVRAHSADEALLALVQEEFALLILDIRLPGMTGFELAQVIKERKKTAGVPIIFLTAYYDKDQHVLEGYGTGAVDFLNKPVNPAVLRSKVSVFADLHRSNRAITRANRALTSVVGERRRVEEDLRELYETLEHRVTERSEALRAADRKLQAVMASITDGVLMLDRSWCFTYFNEQGARILGMRPDQLAGACFWELLPHARDTQFQVGFHRAVNTRQTVSFEEFYPEPLNIWLHCHCYPSDDGLSVYFHDITDRREVEVRREQLLAAEQAARSEGERVARAKEEFLASLSHELRTPLAAIAGWANVLQKPDTDAETMRRGVDAIVRNAQAQTHLVDDLLEMSRVVSGKMRMNVARVDLDSIAAAAADTARPAAAAKGVRIEVKRTDGPALEVMGDGSRLQQVAANLLTNALKFTPANGTVTISTASDDQHVELAVSDTGEGIAAEFLPYLFDRFSQADGSAARVHGGLGLGLSIVKNLVELHGGTVTASSAGKGKGSTFAVRLPRPAGLPAPMQPQVEPDHEPGDRVGPTDEAIPDAQVDLHGVSVLLVDDHADMLEVERRLLSEWGATVTTADSAPEALERLRTGHFDVLLSDLGMPGMDGYRLIDTIRSTLGLSAERLPAAAVTAFVRAEDRERALRAGYQSCIQKPVSPATLARAVLDLARRRDATDPGLEAPATRLRALFVEDNDDLREQIGWMLEQEGLDFVPCSSAEEAELEFGRGHFDVVITDVSLPSMTGVELARRLLMRSPQTWVIFSTGYSMDDKLSGFGPRVRALLKPFEADDIHRLMNEVRVDRVSTQ